MELPDKDYVILPDGRLVFTAGFLKRRGFCCGNGCLNCPYDYTEVPEPKRSELIRLRIQKNKANEGS